MTLQTTEGGPTDVHNIKGAKFITLPSTFIWAMSFKIQMMHFYKLGFFPEVLTESLVVLK